MLNKSIKNLLVLYTSIFFVVNTLVGQPKPNIDSKTKNQEYIDQIYKTKDDTIRLRLIKEFIDKTIDTDVKLASFWITEGITQAKKTNNKLRLIDFNLQSLRFSNQQGSFKSTIGKGHYLENLVQKSGTPIQRVARLTSMANAMQRLGLYDSAAIIYNKAILICKEHRLKETEVNASMNIAVLFQYQNRITEMKEHLLATLELAKKYDLSANIPAIKINLSNAEARLNNFGKAIDYLLEVVPFYTTQNNQYALGLIYSNLSWCYFKSDKLNEALNYARKSYVIRKSLNDAAGLTHLELNLGKIFLATAKFDSANFYALSSLKKSKELNIVSDIRDNYETLSRINELTKNYTEALEYAKLFADWKDSANNIEKNKLVEQELQKIKYDSLDYLRQTISSAELQKTKSKQLNYVLIGLVIILCALLIFVYLKLQKIISKTNKNYQEVNNTTNSNLDQTHTQHLQEAYKLNEQLKQQLADLQLIVQKQQATDIKELRELVESNKLHTDSYWNEFLLLFSRVYPNFFKNIKENYPDLTQYELRLCAMIKLNNSILDTAKVMNITVDSVRKARYRLYKKMNLNNDQELADVILKH